MGLDDCFGFFQVRRRAKPWPRGDAFGTLKPTRFPRFVPRRSNLPRQRVAADLPFSLPTTYYPERPPVLP